MLSPRDTSQIERYTQTLKVKEWKKVCHANGKEGKVGVAVLIPDKIDTKIKTMYSKRHRMTLLYDKGNNPTRGYNPSKHLHI